MKELCKALTPEEIMAVYDAWGPEHFPDSELKPLSSVKMLLERGQYSGYGLYEGSAATEGGLLGYALLMHDKDREKMLLDYYAFMEEYRCRGLGSVFLHEIQKQTDFPGCFIECEAPETADCAEQRELRERRIRFYERNGAVLTQVRAQLFGVTYRMLVLSPLKEELHGENCEKTACKNGGETGLRETLQKEAFCEGQFNQEAFLEALRDFYLSIYPISVFEKNFRLWNPEN